MITWIVWHCLASASPTYFLVLVPGFLLSFFKLPFSHVRDQLLFAILSALYIKASNRSWLQLLLPAVKEGGKWKRKWGGENQEKESVIFLPSWSRTRNIKREQLWPLASVFGPASLRVRPKTEVRRRALEGTASPADEMRVVLLRVPGHRKPLERCF